MSAMSRIRLINCYSHKDERQRITLGDHLAQMQREGVIAAWVACKNAAGQEWAGESAPTIEGKPALR